MVEAAVPWPAFSPVTLMFPKEGTIRPGEGKSHLLKAAAFSIAHCSILTELQIAILLSRIAIVMKLGEKLRYLREAEGSLRGLGRAMTQQELVRAIKAEMKTPMSQSYLSQIESGARPHLTNTTRQLLAKFFKVHPGYLVDDPEGYHAELMSEARVLDDKLDLWLVSGAERFPRDPELRKALLALAEASGLEAMPAVSGVADRDTGAGSTG